MFRRVYRPIIYSRLCHGHSRDTIPKPVCPNACSNPNPSPKINIAIPTDMEMLIVLNVMNVAINLTMLCVK